MSLNWETVFFPLNSAKNIQKPTDFTLVPLNKNLVGLRDALHLSNEQNPIACGKEPILEKSIHTPVTPWLLLLIQTAWFANFGVVSLFLSYIKILENKTISIVSMLVDASNTFIQDWVVTYNRPGG